MCTGRGLVVWCEMIKPLALKVVVVGLVVECERQDAPRPHDTK